MAAKRIMVVDDDRDLVEETAELLKMQGYEVSGFNSGVEAARMLEDIMPDLALVDLTMNGQSGFELANIISHRAATAHIPVLGMTGYCRETGFKGLMRAVGVRESLGKPFSPELLLQIIEKLLKPRLALAGGDTTR